MKYMFKYRSNADCLIAELEELNILARGSIEFALIKEMFESTMDKCIQCRHRYCGTCNGVACEDSVVISIPTHLMSATFRQRELATKTEPTRIQLAA